MSPMTSKHPMKHPMMSRRLPLAVAVFAAVYLSACFFEPSPIEGLPDSVFGDTADVGGNGNGGNGDDDDSSASGCPRSVPTLADFGDAPGALTGTWARRIVLPTGMDTRETGLFSESTTTLVEKVVVQQNGRKVRETVELCGKSMPVVDGAQISFPASFVQGTAIQAEEGEFLAAGAEANPVGQGYASASPFIRLYGLTTAAATKPWAKCISYFDEANTAVDCPIYNWPEIIDGDCDGAKALTAKIAFVGDPLDDIQFIRRTAMQRSGQVETKDRIAGAVTFEESQAILASTKALFKFNPGYHVCKAGDDTAKFPFCATPASFIMVRVADVTDGVDCAAVLAAKFD